MSTKFQKHKKFECDEIKRRGRGLQGKKTRRGSGKTFQLLIRIVVVQWLTGVRHPFYGLSPNM